MKCYLIILIFFYSLFIQAQNITRIQYPTSHNNKIYQIIKIHPAPQSLHPKVTITSQKNNDFYRKYDTPHNTIVIPTYNSLIPIEQLTQHNYTKPFENDITIGNIIRVNRNDTPNDPSVPIKNGYIPIVIYSIIWYIKQLRIFK